MISPAIWESLVESTADAVVIADLQGRILAANRAFERIYGWSRDEVVGMRLRMVPSPLREDAERLLNAARQGGRAPECRALPPGHLRYGRHAERGDPWLS